MSISVADNFSYQGSKPLDNRIKYSTVAEMKNVADANLYDGCLAYVTATKKNYQWDSSNSVDSTTGRWREFSSGGGEDANAYHTSDATETTLADGDYFPFQDVSASTKRKTLWSNIKSVLKTYFDTIYNPKLTAGTNISITSNTISALATVDGFFDKSDLYSTTEKVVGCWHDGRPLYQISYTFNTGTSTPKKITTLSSSITIKNIRGYCSFGGDSDVVPIAWRDPNTDFLGVYQEGTGLYVAFDSAFNNKAGVVTIQYTKTTDSANSYNYANANDYSTEEKIVGTWVDGSNLYQRTIVGTTSSSGNNTSVISLNKNYFIRKFEGTVRQDTGVYVQMGYTNSIEGAYTDAQKDAIFAYTDGGYVKIMHGEFNRGKTYCLTIQYTK